MEPKKIVWVLRWYESGRPCNQAAYPYWQGGIDGFAGTRPASLRESKNAATEFESPEAARAAVPWTYRRDATWGWRVMRRTKRAS